MTVLEGERARQNASVSTKRLGAPPRIYDHLAGVSAEPTLASLLETEQGREQVAIMARDLIHRHARRLSLPPHADREEIECEALARVLSELIARRLDETRSTAEQITWLGSLAKYALFDALRAIDPLTRGQRTAVRRAQEAIDQLHAEAAAEGRQPTAAERHAAITAALGPVQIGTRQIAELGPEVLYSTPPVDIVAPSAAETMLSESRESQVRVAVSQALLDWPTCTTCQSALDLLYGHATGVPPALQNHEHLFLKLALNGVAG